MSVIGWDIGGVNTKVARAAGGRIVAVHHRPYELQYAPARLVTVLRELAAVVNGDASASHAVTMTAELSQLFRTKREGVHFVLDAVEQAFPGSAIRVFGVDGRFHDVTDACANPMLAAAANWMATAAVVSRWHPDALLVDVGTTTTDIIPIVGGQVVAEGRTDPARLASGELVYTGALRTPVEAIASHVPVGGVETGLSAEGFALSGDVHRWRGDLAVDDYTVPAPDRRPATREFVGERLARAVCADRDILDEAGISAIADALASAQSARIASAIARIVARHPSLETAVTTGLGAFIGERAARSAGLAVMPLSIELGHEGARCAPASAVALLGDDCVPARDDSISSPGARRRARPSVPDPSSRATSVGHVVDVVVKVGGGMLSEADSFHAVMALLARDLRNRRALVVPGGGPMADAVRDLDTQFTLTDDEAHWMAIQSMDQCATLVASRLQGSALVSTPADVAVALDAGRLPVLAPYRWLREADPLRHSWDVTSDSLAAWIAGALGARRLVVVKPPGARGDRVVDPEFARATPEGLSVDIAGADELGRLHELLGESGDPDMPAPARRP